MVPLTGGTLYDHVDAVFAPVQPIRKADPVDRTVGVADTHYFLQSRKFGFISFLETADKIGVQPVQEQAPALIRDPRQKAGFVDPDKIGLLHCRANRGRY